MIVIFCDFRYRELEDRSMKLSGALEEVYRLMAQQEMRRKRDRLAADCVRLGKIITIRTGKFSVMSIVIM